MSYTFKKFFLLALCAAFFFRCTPDSDRLFTPTSHNINHAHNFYADGERLTYSVEYGFINLGNVNIVTDPEPIYLGDLRCHHVSAHCELKGLAGFVSHFNDRWDSYVDASTLLPYKFARHLEENKYRKDEYCLFDRVKNEVTVVDTTNKNANTSKIYKISPGIEDIISAYFLFRNINFEEKKKGDTITIDVFLDNVSHNFKLRYIGKEKIKTEDGKRTAITVVPIISGIKGLAGGETPIKAWFSDDPKKLLLKVRAQLVVGSLELALQKHEDRTKLQP